MSAKQRRYFGGSRRRAAPSFSRRRSRRSGGLLGVNVKSMIAGGAGLIVVKMVRERFINLGNYNTAADSIVTGGILGMLKLDNKDLITAGVKQAVAQGGKDLLSGTLFGGSTSSMNGGV